MKIRFCITISVYILFIIFIANITIASDLAINYARLVELIKPKNIKSTFYIFSDYEESIDKDLHKANIEFFNQNPNIIDQIKADLDNQLIRWRLENISHRLLYAPESRREYIALFESYCYAVIDDILSLTKLNNPYTTIQTLGTNKPIYPDTKGINAFIVHNLAKEYVATYVFSNNDQKEIKIKLTGEILLNEIGSFSSYIYFDEKGSLEFVRDQYTIWQNNANNPYIALMTPVEETLHITLRKYTEKAIKDRIGNSSAKTIIEIENIVEYWISIEEAIVGGLVNALLPPILQKYNFNVPNSFFESNLETKRGFKKYRHLSKGIKIVNQLGYTKSIKLYKDDPKIFRDLLI